MSEPERPRRKVRVALVSATALALLTGYLALDAVDVVPGILTSDLGAQRRVPGWSSQVSAHPTSAPHLATSGTPARGAASRGTGNPGGASAAPAAPTPTGLRKVLGPLAANPALGRSLGIQVRDGVTGAVLYDHSAGIPQAPASTAKVLTAVAVAEAEDLRARFVTEVVQVDEGTIALVAGGDNLLAAGRGTPGVVVGRAGLADLAAQTASALGARDARGVRLVLDDTFARGPALAPRWEPADVTSGLTGPVAMLGLSTDRALPGHPAGSDPGLLAAQTLAQALTKAGVPVAGRVHRGAAPASASRLAAVESASVADVLALALDESDNDLTESVARWACARHGAPTSFDGCATWVRDRIADAGLDTRRVRLLDTSGLSRGSAVPASVLAHAVTLAGPPGERIGVVPAAAGAGEGDNPREAAREDTGAAAGEAGDAGRGTKAPATSADAGPREVTDDSQTLAARLAPVLAQLPVAGLSGTLSDRFTEPGARSGLGLVRAKTGTLTGVSSLAGSVVDRQGRLLTFAVVADQVPAVGTNAARAALDRLAAALAECGCR